MQSPLACKKEITLINENKLRYFILVINVIFTKISRRTMIGKLISDVGGKCEMNFLETVGDWFSFVICPLSICVISEAVLPAKVKCNTVCHGYEWAFSTLEYDSRATWSKRTFNQNFIYFFTKLKPMFSLRIEMINIVQYLTFIGPSVCWSFEHCVWPLSSRNGLNGY